MVGKPLPTSFDSGADLRDVQIAARHADPRTTMRYERARSSLDRHATYIVAALHGLRHLTKPASPAARTRRRRPTLLM